MRNKTKIFLVCGTGLVVAVSVYAYSYFHGGLFPFVNSVPIKENGEIVIHAESIARYVVVDDALVMSGEERVLSFLSAGKIEAAIVSEGSMVNGGDSIIRLDTKVLEFQKKSLEANLSGADASLAKLETGLTNSELSIPISKVSGAKKSVGDLKKAMISVLRAGYTQGDDAVRGKTNQLFSAPGGASPQLSFSLNDTDLESDIEREKAELEDMLESWDDRVDDLNADKDFDKEVKRAKGNLDDIRSYLDKVALAVNTLSAGGGITDDTIALWKASLSAGRSEVDMIGIDIQNALYALNVAVDGYTVSRKELAVAEVAPRNEDRIILQSTIDDIKNKIALIDANIREATIIAPARGRILKIYSKEHEVVSPGQAVVVFSDLEQRIEADVPEDKISGVRIGDAASISTPNVPGLKIAGRIDSIEPKAIEKDGDIYYRVRISIDESNQSLLSGMTTEARIYSQEQDEMIRIPESYIIRRGIQDSVMVKTGNDYHEVEVEIGGIDNNMVEIKSGLSDGDVVVDEKI